MSPVVIITMGGVGRRFREVGYTSPKYRIAARGRSLFDWSICSLQSFIDAGSPFVLMVQRADEAGPFIAERMCALGIQAFEVLELDGMTDGQATTAMLAQAAVGDATTPIAIFNIDTHVSPAAMPASAVRGDGWVPCFSAPGDKWSFARADEFGRILEMREKKRISDHATLGLYYFGSFELYADAYRATFDQGGTLEAGERYIAPMYNAMIAQGAEIYLHEVPAEAVTALGTPEDLALFDPAASPANVF